MGGSTPLESHAVDLPALPTLNQPTSNEPGYESAAIMFAKVQDKILGNAWTKAQQFAAQGKQEEALIALRDAASEAIRQLQAYPGQEHRWTWKGGCIESLKKFYDHLRESIAQPYTTAAKIAALDDDWDVVLQQLELLNSKAPSTKNRDTVCAILDNHLERLEKTDDPRAQALRQRYNPLK